MDLLGLIIMFVAVRIGSSYDAWHDLCDCARVSADRALVGFLLMLVGIICILFL